MKIFQLLKNVLSLLQWPPRAQTLKLFYLRGQLVDTVRSWMEEAWQAEMVSRIFSIWQPAIQWLKAHNGRMVLLSGTPLPLAEPLMHHFQIDEALCAKPEIVNRRYSGRLLKPHPKGMLKVHYAEEWLNRHGATWPQTIAIANDWPDRFLLHQSRAVVIRPSRRLQRLAKQKGWPMVKDVNHETDLVRILSKLMT